MVGVWEVFADDGAGGGGDDGGDDGEQPGGCHAGELGIAVVEHSASGMISRFRSA